MKIESGRIEFVFAMVRAERPEHISFLIGGVVDAGLEENAMADIVGPMVVLAFGTHKATAALSTSRTSLVARLQRFGESIKIVHGASDGHFGIFGSDKRCAFTFILPQFEEVLATLMRLDFGDTEELPQ